MPCHAGTGFSLCGRGGLLCSKHILCETENSVALARWKGIAHPRTWEPRRAFTGRRRTGSAFPTLLLEAACSLLPPGARCQPLPRCRRSLLVGLDAGPVLAATAEGLCRAAGLRAGLARGHPAFFRLPFPSRLQWPPGASPVLSRSPVLASGVCLSLLTEQIPLRPRKEPFCGHELVSVNKQLQGFLL